MNTTRTAALALVLALAACARTELQAPAPAGSGSLQDAAPPSPPTLGNGRLKLRTVYDYVGDREGTPWARFELNGDYNYPEPIYGGWPIRITPVDASGSPTGPTEEITTLQELSPTDGRYVERPPGRYRVELRLPTVSSGGVWSVTEANSSLREATTAAGPVASQVVTVAEGETTVARFFTVCRAEGQVLNLPEPALDAASTYIWPCRASFVARPPGPPVVSFRDAPSLREGRLEHTATLLPDGTVLVAGGDNSSAAGGTLATAELYDPAGAGAFRPTGRMVTPRAGHTATLLPDGRVLLAGGANRRPGANGEAFPLAAAELYDPATGAFAPTGSLNVARARHSATLLRDGRVLVTGGSDDVMGYTATAELYDPATGVFTRTGSMRLVRVAPATAPLPDGRVLVAQGIVIHGGPNLKRAELYNPRAGAFELTGEAEFDRTGPCSSPLSDGRVLVVGGTSYEDFRSGFDSSVLAAEVYGPGAGAFSRTGSLDLPRSVCAATLLPDGRVLVSGGVGGGFYDTAGYVYDPATGAFTRGGDMAALRSYHTATLLANGEVLVVGGERPGEGGLGVQGDASAEVGTVRPRP